MKRNIIFHSKSKFISITVFSLLLMGLLVDTVNSDVNDSHTDLKCATCHSMQEKLIVKRKKCLTCHNSIQENNYLEMLSFHKDDNRQCVDCHTFHDTKYLHVDSAKFQFDYSLESSKATCFGCHKANGSIESLTLGHQEARKLYHSDLIKENNMTPSQSCMVCHDPAYSNIEFEFEIDYSKMPAINNHASHPYEIEIVRGKGNATNRIRFEIDPKINLFDNRIECQTCHTLTTENKYLVVNSEKSSNFCNGCHEHNGTRVDLVSTP